MSEKTRQDLCERTMVFALRVMRMADSLGKETGAPNAGSQVVRAACSVGANYRASQRGRSRADFANKVAIVLEEADEVAFWLELIERGGFLPASKLKELRKEADELVRIFSTMRATARKRPEQ